MITHWVLHRPWIPGQLQRTAIIALVFAAAIYLNIFPGGFNAVIPPLDWLFDLGWPLAIAAGIAVVAMVWWERLEWQGPIEVDGVDGPGWARSLRSRIGLLAYVPFWLLLALVLFDLAQRTWYAADWGRFAVSAFLCLDVLMMALGSLAGAISRRRMLAIEPEGVRFGETLMPFGHVRRIQVKGDLRERQVALLTEDGKRLVDLQKVGITARTFVARLQATAPDLPVDWPVQAEASV